MRRALNVVRKGRAAQGNILGASSRPAAIEQQILQALEREVLQFPVYVARCAPNPVIERQLGWRGNSCESLPINILPNSPCLAIFRADEANLSEIQILCAVHGRENFCAIEFDLFDLSGPEPERVYTETLGASVFRENSFHAFSFPPLVESAGRWYVARLSSSDATPHNCIAAWCLQVPRNSDTFRTLERDDARGLISTVDWKALNLAERSQGALEKIEPLTRRLPSSLAGARALVLVPDASPLPDSTPELLELLEREAAHFALATPTTCESLLAEISDFEFVFLSGLSWSPPLIPLLRAFYYFGTACILLDYHGTADSTASAAQSPKITAALRGRVESDERSRERLVENCDGILSRADLRSGQALAVIQRIVAEYNRQALPSFSIVSVLYAKEREIEYFLEALLRQTYLGDFEIILVDDKSPDDSAGRVQRFVEKARAELGGAIVLPPITVLPNTTNIGNCGSRNRGIAAASGEIVVVIDADCVVNDTFLQAHANEYRDPQTDVVLGFFNLETGDRPPLNALKEYEAAPTRVEQEAELQDSTHRASFLNCITRNFSIRRSQISEPLFDELFAYSENPESGFGWEDVEMGFRLYERGLTIRFTPRAFSLHISHPSASEESTKPLRSLKNFRRLLEKHPSLPTVARRWVLETYQKITRWSDLHKQPLNEDRQLLDALLHRSAPLMLDIAPRPLRVLTYRWHCAHQYELYKLGCEFSLASFPTETFTNGWAFTERPLPRNAKFVPIEQIREWEYDLAILHFDENVLASYNCNGVIGPNWGHCFRWFRENVKLPFVAICHGTPQFRGQYNPNYPFPDLGETIEEERRRLVEYLGDTLVILNSYQAQAEWGFKNSNVIWHGFDPAEFQTTSYRRGILSLGKPMRDRPVYRGYQLYQQTAALLPPENLPVGLAVPEPRVSYGRESNSYALAKYELYRRALREFSVYFNPTLRSPMPRSRGEAMMSGLVSVSAKNHDVDRFIENERNGFFSDDPQQLADYLRFLLTHPRELREIGFESRKLSTDLFNHDRYLRAWQHTINRVLGSTAFVAS